MADPRVETVVRGAVTALRQAATEFRPQIRVAREGRVRSATEAVLTIHGLPDAGAEELLEISESVPALVLGLRPGVVEAVALYDATDVREGAAVRALHRAATIPAGEAVLGRILDPMGRPLDGAPLADGLPSMSLERRAPAIYERAAVHEPLYTGTLCIDAMLPIGRGQRELILGDEGTGKTALVLDVMLRQSDTDVVCVYVAIGRRRSEIARLVDALRQGGGEWVVIGAPQDSSPGLRYLAPYAGTAIAEWFMERGGHAVVVYDDLSAHAVAWRELSLLLRRPPGREAYPGDVFYLHSRLLERATQLSPERGGGSLTALPIAVTEDERLSAYIPTNLISITDGQIILSRRLFAAGQKPAINTALSVSRVGGKAQAQAFRELANRLRLDYATFLELEVFARLGTRLEERTSRRLELGRRIRMLLRAPQRAPLGIFEELVRLVLVESSDLLLRIPTPAVQEVAASMAAGCRRAIPALAERVDRDAVLTAADRHELVAAMERIVAHRFGEDEPEECADD